MKAAFRFNPHATAWKPSGASGEGAGDFESDGTDGVCQATGNVGGHGYVGAASRRPSPPPPHATCSLPAGTKARSLLTAALAFQSSSSSHTGSADAGDAALTAVPKDAAMGDSAHCGDDVVRATSLRPEADPGTSATSSTIVQHRTFASLVRGAQHQDAGAEASPTSPRSAHSPGLRQAASPRVGPGGGKEQTFEGSPVTTAQVAPRLQLSEARAYRSLGPRDFRAIREIGQGAFGKVYLVQSHTTKRFYAMKVLNKQRVLAREQVAYAMGERAVMSALDHPYLVALRFAFQTSHRLFLVMDYIEGGHLWTHMRAGFLAEPVAKVFAAEIALALAHLHARGIAHRDLKPENILLDSERHLRLTDFGLAKRDLDEDSRVHTMVGTIDYMAPEIIKGDGHGRAVDWWSLGVLLYEMLFARLPFAPLPARGGTRTRRGKDPRMEPGTEEYKAEVKRKIQHGKIPWPRGPYVNPVTVQAKNLIQRLLTKVPEQRLQGREVMQHDWFKDIDWDALLARKVPSPLRSSIFAGAPDKLSQKCTEMAPLEVQCPRLAGYLFEKDTPTASPAKELLSNFQGFSFVHESELSAAASNDAQQLAQAF